MGTAITEPDAGCDVTQAVTTAVKDGSEWVINGTKMFATNGNLATVLLVFCQTDPENPSRHRQHSFILVPTDTPGYQATKIRGKLGIRASDTAEVSLKDVRVPQENLIGKAGEGFYELMAFFNRTRLHICAQAVGLARAALEESIRHTKGRKQFGQPLASFQVTRFKIAEMATKIRAARNLYYEAAWAADQRKYRPCPHRHGQVVFRKNCCGMRRRGPADAWRIWIHRRVQSPATISGCQDPGNLRGHEGDGKDDYCRIAAGER